MHVRTEHLRITSSKSNSRTEPGEGRDPSRFAGDQGTVTQVICLVYCKAWLQHGDPETHCCQQWGGLLLFAQICKMSADEYLERPDPSAGGSRDPQCWSQRRLQLLSMSLWMWQLQEPSPGQAEETPLVSSLLLSRCDMGQESPWAACSPWGFPAEAAALPFRSIILTALPKEVLKPRPQHSRVPGTHAPPHPGNSQPPPAFPAEGWGCGHALPLPFPPLLHPVNQALAQKGFLTRQLHWL